VQVVGGGAVAAGQADGSSRRKTTSAGTDETLQRCDGATAAAGRRETQIRTTGVQCVASQATLDGCSYSLRPSR